MDCTTISERDCERANYLSNDCKLLYSDFYNRLQKIQTLAHFLDLKLEGAGYKHDDFYVLYNLIEDMCKSLPAI